MIREHGDVIEADLQRHYRVNLMDLWTGGLTVRRALVLIDNLPPDSETARQRAGLTALPGWSLSDALTGRLLDEMTFLRWEWESAHLPKGGQKRPEPKSVFDTGEPAAYTGGVEVPSRESLNEFLTIDRGE